MSSVLQSPGAGGHWSATWHAASSLARAEGIGGFYRGFGACLLGFVPAQASYFAGYEVGKVGPCRKPPHLPNNTRSSSSACRCWAG